jgi:hypothetical protein
MSPNSLILIILFFNGILDIFIGHRSGLIRDLWHSPVGFILYAIPFHLTERYTNGAFYLEITLDFLDHYTHSPTEKDKRTALHN